MDNISISGEEVTAITITSGGNGWIYGDDALNAPERIVPVSNVYWSAMWKFLLEDYDTLTEDSATRES